MTSSATRAGADLGVGPEKTDLRVGPGAVDRRLRASALLPAALTAVALVALFASTTRAADAGDVQVRATVDRTAAWVADRVVYSIELACKPGVDILDDDLSREKLKLDGFEIVSVDAGRDTAADGSTIHRFRYVLTTYRVDVPELRVAPLTVRYYAKRAGQRLQDAAPAGEVQVPGTVVALRSMLPDQRDTAALRDEAPAVRRATLFTLAQPVGLGLVIASIAPVLFWATAVVAKRRQRTAHRSARQVRSEERASIEVARALDVSSPESRREAYTRINEVVREHLRDVCGVSGPSLTPAEVAPALTARGSRVPADTVAALLAECERARYAPAAALPTADACRDALAQAEQVLAIR